MRAKDNKSNINLNVSSQLKEKIRNYAIKNGYSMTEAITYLLNFSFMILDDDFVKKITTNKKKVQ